tara:strand:+ start:8539 stop:8790 length:252 start_codon:yes stop_codon:yes gene_type:complete
MREKIKQYIKGIPDKVYQRLHDWMWSRKESAFDKAILDRYNNDFVPYEKEYFNDEFKEYLEYNEKNPDRLFPKYDEKLNRIWE